jgi:hypothetical protein
VVVATPGRVDDRTRGARGIAARQRQGGGVSAARSAVATGVLAGRVDGWRRRLQLVAAARGAFMGAGAAGAVLAVTRAAGDGTSLGLTVALVAGGLVAIALWWRGGGSALSATRAALWLEEHEPSLKYALVTAVDPETTAATRAAVERAAQGIAWEAPARVALQRALRLPVALAFTGLALALWAPAVMSRVAATRGASPARGAASTPPAALGPLQVRVEPPAYTGLASERLDDPALVRAYPGSRLSVRGTGDTTALHALRDSSVLPVVVRDGGWEVLLATGTSRALIRVARAGGEARLIALEPRLDSAPVVTLRLPARDTVLREPGGTFPLAADLHDDLGLASATFEYIVSSGEGERFTFKRGTIGALPAVGARRGPLNASLSLASLGIVAGDVVHLRAVARDRNTVAGAGVGSSDTRSIRVARAGEYDSVAVEQAPPPEIDKSVLSQRMLINLTEALVRRARSMPRDAVVAESRRIGRDQARLRRQVSDIIFARLGDGAEGAGEHFHGDGHGHDESEQLRQAPLTPEALLKAAEKATAIAANPTDFEHDETPVVAINRPMLEAYNAMWDAGRALDVAEPARALPPMYAALAAIQRARAAERLYLRGAPPRVVVDLAKVRMQGKDRGDPARRTPRLAMDAPRQLLLARFARALDALDAGDASSAGASPVPGGDASAGIDSLIVLRLAAAERLPAAASALEQAIDALRTGRDATEPLLRARRALDDGLVTGDALPSWGGRVR